MPRPDSGRSLAQKYSDYDKNVHSTWDPGQRPASRATVTVPGKSSVAARLFGRAKTAVGSSIRKTVDVGRGLFTGGSVDPADPHASQRRNANTKQREMKGLHDLITGVQQADLVAGMAKRIVNKR